MPIVKRTILNHMEVIIGVAIVVIAVAIAAVAVDLRHEDTARADRARTLQTARADRARTLQTARELRAYGYSRDIQNWHEKLKGCGRTKSDRTSTAKALRAQSTYLRLVLDAASVKEDVKTAARMTQRVFNTSASSLESRTGKGLICTVVYPKPVAPSGVTELP